MKKTCLLLAIATLLSTACNCTRTTPVTPEDPIDFDVPPQPVPTPSFAKGADISWVSEMEKDGRTFQLKSGAKADIMDVLKETGVNAIRLRVWVNPTGGWSGKDDVVKLATRAAKAGLALMVDFHYSDFFADPGRQDIPGAWAADKNDLDKMAKHVSDHTTEVLKALQDASVTPNWVQVGNETRNGMLWPTGSLSQGGEEWTDKGWENYIHLYKAGYSAVKSVFPSCIVMPHLNNAFNPSNDNYWWFKRFKESGAPYDMIALSHYPQDSWENNKQVDWDNANSRAINYIKSLAADMGVSVIVAEIGVKTNANLNLATQVMSEFMSEAKKIDKCTGIFYWEPEVDGKWKPAVYGPLGWNAYDMGAFTADGKATSVMDAFK